MKMKSVTFEDYAKAKIGNESKTYGQLIDIAWRNSEEGLRLKKSRQKTVKIFTVGCLAVLSSTLVLSPSTKAFADVLGVQELAQKNSFVVYKLKIACNFYKDCLSMLGVERAPDLFMDIMKNGFDVSEIHQIITSAKGLSLDELVQLVPSL